MTDEIPAPPNGRWEPSTVFWMLSILFALLALLVAAGGIYKFAINDFPPYSPYSSYIPRALKVKFAQEVLLGFAACSIASCLLYLLSHIRPKTRVPVLTGLEADSLSERATRATSSLQEATRLVHELTEELTARTALLEGIKRQVAEAKQRAEEMDKLSEVDEETTRILNKYFDDALKTRLHDLERDARRRELLLGTLGAVVFGIITILLSHYLFGF